MLGRGRECSRRLIASNLQSTIRDLQRRKARGRRGLALIEGVRLVEEALAAGVAFKGALVAPDLARPARGTALVAELQGHAVEVAEVGERRGRRAPASGARAGTREGGSGTRGRTDRRDRGNEGAGIRPQLNAVAAQRVAIPLAQGAESLNVAVAAGILLYEVTRGR